MNFSPLKKKLFLATYLFEGLILRGAYIRRGLSTEGNLRFKIDWASLIVGSTFTVFALFTLYLRAIFQEQTPGGLYLEGRFNGGFFALPVWGAYIWRGLYMEGLIFGILRYLCDHSFEFRVATPNTIVRLIALDDYELYECFFRRDF